MKEIGEEKTKGKTISFTHVQKKDRKTYIQLQCLVTAIPTWEALAFE